MPSIFQLYKGVKTYGCVYYLLPPFCYNIFLNAALSYSQIIQFHVKMLKEKILFKAFL